MAALATLSLNDSVPTARSFVPVGGGFNPVTYEYRATALRATNPKISIGSRSPMRRNGALGVYRQTVKVDLPVPDTVDSTKVAHTLLCKVEFVIPENASALDKKNLAAYVASAIAHAVVKTDLVENAELPY